MTKTHNSALCHYRSIWISTPRMQSSRASRTPLPLPSWQHRGKFTAWWRTTPIPGLSTPTSSKNCVKLPAVTASELSRRQTQHPVLESFVYRCACVNRPLMMFIPVVALCNAPECKSCTQRVSWKNAKLKPFLFSSCWELSTMKLGWCYMLAAGGTLCISSGWN